MRWLSAFIALSAFACVPGTALQPERPPVTYCELLPEAQCIESPRCTLEIVRRADVWYVCRDNVDPCEKGFLQLDATAESCQAQPGCGFEQPNCYCAPGVACACAGGRPPRCKTIPNRSSRGEPDLAVRERQSRPESAVVGASDRSNASLKGEVPWNVD